MAAAAAFAPAPCLRLKPTYSTLRFLSLYPRPTTLVPQSKPPHLIFPPSLPRRRRSFCTVVAAALHSGGTKPEISETWKAETRAGEFRKKLKVVDIKGGPDEGLDRLGQTLVVTGWVRTFRVQSSVTFIEVNVTQIIV